MQTSSSTSLIARLRQLRTQITQWLLVDGGRRFLWVLIAVIFVDLLLDWTFELDRPQRVVMLVLAACGLAWMGYRWLIRPIGRKVTDDALCLEVEQRHPELGQSLISALQLSRVEDPEGQGTSQQLSEATIQSGFQAVDRLSFSAILDRIGLRRNFIWLFAGLAVLLGTGLSTLASDTMSIWWNRNVLLGERRWPQDVFFSIDHLTNGELRIPAGEDWPVVVTVDTVRSRRTPSNMRLEIRSGTGVRVEPLEREGRGERFRALLTGVTTDCEIRALEQRAATEWTAVKVLQRPSLDSLELLLTPPQYTRLPAAPLPAGAGQYSILPGSKLTLTGISSKPLSAAELHVGKTLISVPVTDERTIKYDLAPEQLTNEIYQLDLIDRDTVTLPGTAAGSNSESAPDAGGASAASDAREVSLRANDAARFRVKIKADQEPQLEVSLIGISTLIARQAQIPFRARIRDDFEVSDVQLVSGWKGEADQAELSQTIPLSAQAGVPKSLAQFDAAFDMATLGLSPGTNLRFHLEAKDNNTIGGPSTGKSAPFQFRVVTEEELRADILRREREMRAELERALKNQDDLQTECEVTAAALDQQGASLPGAGQMTQFHRRQKNLSSTLAGTQQKLENLVLEIANNRLEDASGPLRTRLGNYVVRPLGSLTEEFVPKVLQSIDRARRDGIDVPAAAAAFDEVVAGQQKIIDQLREILRHLEQAEGYQEAVNAALEVQRAQEEVRRRTEQEKAEAIKRALGEPAGKSPEKTEPKP